jgi:hypothetical protein
MTPLCDFAPIAVEAHQRPVHLLRSESHLHASDIIFTVSVLTLCVWMLVESAWEFEGQPSGLELTVLVSVQVLSAALACAAILGNGPARTWFAFLCAVGVVAIAPDLPYERAVSTDLFVVSATGFACRLFVVLAYALWHSLRVRRDRLIATTLASPPPQAWYIGTGSAPEPPNVAPLQLHLRLSDSPFEKLEQCANFG